MFTSETCFRFIHLLRMNYDMHIHQCVTSQVIAIMTRRCIGLTIKAHRSIRADGERSIYLDYLAYRQMKSVINILTTCLLLNRSIVSGLVSPNAVPNNRQLILTNGDSGINGVNLING